jgi:hypothetical protein
MTVEFWSCLKKAVYEAHGAMGDTIAVAVAIPESIKEITAANERGLKRARPQTPWPEVQPLLNLVPNPTQNPPIP